MSIPGHMSPQEFDAFMKERNLKRIEKVPKDKKACITGCYFDIYFKDNKQVECANCGIPLYVRYYIYDIAKERNWPILCQYCTPLENFKGTVVQDIAAVLQHTGE